MAKAPLVFRTDRVTQIKIFAYDGYPSFRLRYRYTPDTMSGELYNFHYLWFNSLINQSFGSFDSISSCTITCLLIKKLTSN